jgi:hypothetical protein
VTPPGVEEVILAVADKWGPVVSAWKALPLLAGEVGSATLQEADLVEVIVDAGESGTKLARPGMQRLLAWVEHRGGDAVIIAKLDRLTRFVYHFTIGRSPEGTARAAIYNQVLPEHGLGLETQSYA